MIIKPLDMEDQTSGWNTLPIENIYSLTELLDDSRKKPPFLMELQGDNGFKLIIGIGGRWVAFNLAQPMAPPPYLMAAAKEAQEEGADIEFLAGGTATSIPMHQCLPFEFVKRLVFYFFEHGSRSPDVGWEEI